MALNNDGCKVAQQPTDTQICACNAEKGPNFMPPSSCRDAVKVGDGGMTVWTINPKEQGTDQWYTNTGAQCYPNETLCARYCPTTPETLPSFYSCSK